MRGRTNVGCNRLGEAGEDKGRLREGRGLAAERGLGNEGSLDGKVTTSTLYGGTHCLFGNGRPFAPGGATFLPTHA